MESDSGIKLDFSTLISYLLPGFVVEVIIFGIIDSLSIFLGPSRASILMQLRNVEGGQGALLLAVSVGVAYFIGLILDVCAHPPSLKDELNSKRESYRKSYERLKPLIANEQINHFLQSVPAEAAVHIMPTAPIAVKASEPADAKAVEAVTISNENSGEDISNLEIFIDALFSCTANSEAWARHNWHWSFYEAARQLSSLSRPCFIWPIAFYLSLLLCRFFFPAWNRGFTFFTTAAVTVLLVFLARKYIHEILKVYKGQICAFFHTYKANFVFGHLIQSSFVEHTRVLLDGNNKP